jgi:hypothetical protein
MDLKNEKSYIIWVRNKERDDLEDIHINTRIILIKKQRKTNSVALVLKRTIPTERPPLVGEVSANFSGKRASRGQRNESPRPFISVF